MEMLLITFFGISLFLGIIILLLNFDAHGHAAHGGHAKHEESPIDKWKKLDKGIDNLLARIDIDHMAAYVKAADEHLKTDDGHDYGKLEDKELAMKFVDTMMKHYETGARQVFKVKDDAKYSEVEKNMLMQAYLGITKDKLLHQVQDKGEDYTAHYHSSLAAELRKSHEKNLRPVALTHLTEHDLDAIIKHVGVEDKVHKDRMTLDHAKELLLYHKQNEGIVPPKYLKRQHYFKKAEPEHGGHDAHSVANH